LKWRKTVALPTPAARAISAIWQSIPSVAKHSAAAATIRSRLRRASALR